MLAGRSKMVCLLRLDTVSWVRMVKERMDLYIVVELEVVQELEFKRIIYYLQCRNQKYNNKAGTIMYTNC
jgi:hypothetical protein